jgi:hypothetical protein
MATLSTVLKMLFVNPLDLFVEGITRLVARIMRWRPEGSLVVLVVLDPLDPRQRATGRIEQVLRGVVTAGAGGSTRHREPFVVVQLETPLYFHGEHVCRLIAGPRYELNEVTRLILTGWIANLHKVPEDAGSTQSEWVLSFSDNIGIGGFKRTRR